MVPGHYFKRNVSLAWPAETTRGAGLPRGAEEQHPAPRAPRARGLQGRPGWHFHSTPLLGAINRHSLGIDTVIVLSLLPFPVKMAVSP